MISLLLDATLKGSLLLLIGGAAALVLHRSSAAVRHAVWTAATVGVLAIAPLAFLLPKLEVRPPRILAGSWAGSGLTSALQIDPPRGIPAGLTDRPHTPFTPTAAGEPYNLRAILPAIWAGGVLVFAICFVAAGLRLHWIVRLASSVAEPIADRLVSEVAQQLGVPRSRVRLRWTDREFTPMTWGIRRPTLLLPAVSKAWDEERLRHVLVHEIGHIQRWDVLTQALSSAACALYWFNPLVWIAARQMLVERERACDDLVLGSGAKPSSYAHGLLETARSLGARWTAARVSPAMARRSQISGRLLAVLDPGRSRQGLGRRVALLVGAAGAGLILPLAVLRPVPAIQAAAPLVPQNAEVRVAGPGIAEFNAITAGYEEWKSAVQRRDAQAISLLYTSDAMVVTPARPLTRGRQALRELYEHYFAFGLAEVEIHVDEMYAVGDMVCELGRSEARTASGRVLSAGRFMTLWKVEDGKWRAHRDYAAQ